MRLLKHLFVMLFLAPVGVWGVLPSSAHAVTVLVVGDSISAAYGMEEQEGWVQLAEDTLRRDVPEVEFVNASISGDTTSGGLRRLPAALERFNPDVLVIELGGNDGLRGYSLKAMRENLQSMTELAQRAGAEVLILGMQIPTNYGTAYINRFAGSFAEVAEATDAALVPFMLEPIALDVSYFQADGIHPNEAAQPLMAEHVLSQLRALVVTQHAE